MHIYTHIQIARSPSKHTYLHMQRTQRDTHTDHTNALLVVSVMSGITPFVVPHKAARSVIIWERLFSPLQARPPVTSKIATSPLCHPLPHPHPLPSINKAQPFVLSSKIRKKWDICKPNEAYTAASCTPSKAEANCVLLLAKQMTGWRETWDVSEGMGYLLRKSGGRWACMQLPFCLVTVSVSSLKQNTNDHESKSWKSRLLTGAGTKCKHTYFVL